MSRRPVLRVLRALPQRWHRPLAKALFRASGHLSKVKTPQRWYELPPNADDRIELQFGGWWWASCPATFRLLDLSMQLDWDHWDCWALRHEGCDPKPCDECGGCRCEFDEVTA